MGGARSRYRKHIASDRPDHPGGAGSAEETIAFGSQP